MAVLDEVPEAENATRLLNPPGVSQNLIRYKDNMFYETDGLIGDSTMFDLLTYEFLEGAPERALTDPNTVVITDQLAAKLFGKEPALNKVIAISQSGPLQDFKITAVIRNNTKSFIKANFIVSMMSSGWGEYIRSDQAQGEWAGQNFMPSYLRLVPGHSVEEVTKKINDVLVKYGSEDMKALGLTKTLSLEPIKDVYLRSDIGRSPKITYIYIIASIAVFILLLGCINF
jgi:putative ABC transport system permease protein